MKKIFTAIIFSLLLFAIPCQAQYISEIDSYGLYWKHLDGTPPVALSHTFKSDTSIVMAWERGPGGEIPYISPYAGTFEVINVIVNSPSIWDNTEANYGLNVILTNGIYEITITEEDIYNNESGHSDPLFISIEKVIARIQIYLRIE